MTVLLDDSGENVLMAWRHRFAPNIWSWELPGDIVDEGESSEETARRELIEEVGYKPRLMEHLMKFEPAVGMLRNPLHVSPACGAEPVGDPVERNEVRFERVPLVVVPDLIRDSGTLVGL